MYNKTDMRKLKVSFIKLGIIGIGTVLVIAGFAYQHHKPVRQTAQMNESDSNWLTYKNSDPYFVVNYPRNWQYKLEEEPAPIAPNVNKYVVLTGPEGIISLQWSTNGGFSSCPKEYSKTIHLGDKETQACVYKNKNKIEWGNISSIDRMIGTTAFGVWASFNAEDTETQKTISDILASVQFDK